MRSTTSRLRNLIGLLLLVAAFSSSGLGYSVLTHEQVVDLMWREQIAPLLRQRFPAATEDDLQKAHAYAYGGCVLQDMGYYPFGNKFFSDLVHYVRSGDFVEALLRDASDLDEYAFALAPCRTTLRITAATPPSTVSWPWNFPNCARNMATP